MISKHEPVYVAGHRGLAGSAILRHLQAAGYTNLIGRTRAELDLTDRSAVNAFFAENRPAAVFLAAAKVGGILANETWPADFIRENLLIQTHVIDAAARANAGRFFFLASSCIYPKLAPQPLREDYLLTGALEPTNSAYAVAKIAGIEMCRAYQRQGGFQAISLMPTNLYGPGDNFNLQTSHVLAALVRKFHEAKLSNAAEVSVWGTGTPRREFLHVDDLARACVFLLEQPYERVREASCDGLLNVGAGEDLEIRELADIIRQATGCAAKMVFDPSKPDGTPRKLLDIGRMRGLGWAPEITLRAGVAEFCRWFAEHQTTAATI
jgi:GDP-L-fucose synthase